MKECKYNYILFYQIKSNDSKQYLSSGRNKMGVGELMRTKTLQIQRFSCFNVIHSSNHFELLALFARYKKRDHILTDVIYIYIL